jgi:O-antigen/teichoic acid export membrane protein
MLLAGRVLSLLANLAIQVLTVRYLSKMEYGAFAYALSFSTTARIVVTLGHNRTITRFLSIYDEERAYGKLFGTLVMESGIIFVMGGTLFTASLVLRDWLTSTVIHDSLAVTVLSIIMLLAPVEALDDLVEGMFAVFAKSRSIFFRRYLLSPALRLSVVALLIATGSGVVFLALGYVLASAVGVGFYGSVLTRILRDRGMLEHFGFRSLSLPFREVFSFTVPLLSTELVVVSTGTVSIALLGYYASTTAVADLRVILPAAVLNMFVMRSFTLLFTPLASRLYARDDRTGMRDAYWQTAVWLAVVTFPIFGLTAVFAEQVTVTLFGQRYQGSAIYLALLSLGYYVNVSLGFNALILQVFGRLRYLLGVNVGAAVANIGLALALIPRLGALGVAIANCVTLILQNVLNQAGLGRGIGIGLFAWRYQRVYTAVAVGSFALWLLNAATHPPLPLAVVFTGVIALGILLLNRGLLRIDDTFPELRRIPLIRRVLIR